MATFNLESDINSDKYTEYVCDKYDIQDRNKTVTEIPNINIDDLNQLNWNIAILLGNSGSGKSTLLKLFGEPKKIVYDLNKACISQFENVSEEDAANTFFGVGLSSVPTWLRRPNQLSNGEKARLDLAYNIINTPKDELIIIDEFTSVVNRACAKSMSYSLQRYIREQNRKIVLASCHFDIIDWLNPDVIFNLNKQKNLEVETEHLVYKDSEEYNELLNINKDEILTELMEI